MSRQQYQHNDDIPAEAIAKRLDELSDAITKGKAALSDGFDMRIPVEVNRDADIVLSVAAKRLRKYDEMMNSID